MNALDSLVTRVRHVGGFAAIGSLGSGASDGANENENDVSRAYRILRFVKVLLGIVLTALTIGRMLGWL